MSKILVVQPDRMLQQAFIVALFPEHDVEMCSALPHAAPTNFDAVIIDATASEEYFSLNARDLRKTRLWKVPIVWIHDGAVPEAVDQRNATQLERPVTKESLQKALAECLRPSSKTNGGRRSNTQIVAGSTKPKPNKAKPSSPPIVEGKFIELVDVVEEGMVTVVPRTQEKNKF